MIPSVERLRTLVDYDPDTGIFRWKALDIRPKPIIIGDIAGAINAQGYINFCIDGEQWAAHRLAWLYMTGEWPAEDIDHINGVRDDNRWGNLRSCPRRNNARNRRKSSKNSSGYKGVSFHRNAKKWVASITIDGKQKHLGCFDEARMAALAYDKVAIELHGEFARTNF